MKKIIRNIIFICCLFTIGVLCFTYVLTQKNIEWYWLGLGIAGGIIGIILSVFLIAITFVNFEEYFW